MSFCRFFAFLLLAAAPAAVTLHTTPAAAGPVPARAPPACDRALASRQRSFYGYCPCDCQLQSAKNFSCRQCPVTCRRYRALCKPTAVCRRQPAAVRQATWPAECRNVAAGGKCYAKCKPGFAGAGATAQCSAQGWSVPTVQCAPTARRGSAATLKAAGAAAGAAAVAASPPRRQRMPACRPALASLRCVCRRLSKQHSPPAGCTSARRRRQLYQVPAGALTARASARERSALRRAWALPALASQLSAKPTAAGQPRGNVPAAPGRRCRHSTAGIGCNKLQRGAPSRARCSLGDLQWAGSWPEL
ncbi:hypothetical protein COO60DRAFT_621622 [Scenedesmus sp. NREL 46B-D3]|nr:hypothetical protein COO60DRAFT_621622 [Scenedesmus sp. NREL 46B-D3]